MSQQRYVIIRGQVFRWEEKAPFVPSGRSIYGAIEHDIESNKLKCHECGEWTTGLGIHVSKAHGDAKEYKRTHGIRQKTALWVPSLVAAMKERMKGRAIPRGVLVAAAAAKGRQPTARQKAGDISAEKRNERGICDAQLIFKIQQVAAELGRTPTHEEIPESWRSVARDRFGSWRNAVEKAGLTPNEHAPKGIIYSRSILREALRDFFVLNKRIPRVSEFSTGRLPAYMTFRRVYGSLTAAYADAGLALVAQQRGGRVLMGSNAAD